MNTDDKPGSIWEHPESILPAERRWIIGLWPNHNDIGFRAETCRRIGNEWLDWLGRRIRRPRYWTAPPDQLGYQVEEDMP